MKQIRSCQIDPGSDGRRPVPFSIEMPSVSVERCGLVGLMGHTLCSRLVLLLGLSLVLFTLPLQAYTPIYTVKKRIRLSDLAASAIHPAMAIQGLNNSGLLVGYFSANNNYHGTLGSTIQAFAWDDQNQSLYNLGYDILGANQSMATCVNDSGLVAGVYWTGGAVFQQGFTWQGGEATTFTAPLAGRIDTVVAVNASGQAGIATYPNPSFGYKRAFLWDGINSTDLGDLGNAFTSFVWPTSINVNGEVVGTIYDGTMLPASTTAFHWQNESMTALNTEGITGNTSALGINSTGEVIGLTPADRFIAGGLYWSNNSPLDLGSLGGGSTVPFSIDDLGNVMGTSYDADGNLHLFRWANPATTLMDLGAAQLDPSDTGFQLTSVNQKGDAAGFVSDAQGQTQFFVRIAGTAGCNLASLVDGHPSLDCTADDSGGTRVIINDVGLIACSGHDHTGEPVVLLLTPDGNGNGMPDGWEAAYFPNGGLLTGPTDDYDGDGLSNLLEYQRGSDPTDFYNGQWPTLTVVSGGDQRGTPGQWLALPVSVRVNANGAHNAPLHVAVTAGSAQLSATENGGALLASLDIKATAPLPGSGSPPVYVARVWVKLPAANGVSTLTFTAAGNTATTTAIASNPNPQPPNGLVLKKNTATTADIAWTPSDTTLATVAEASYDGQTWAAMATFEPGMTSGTVRHLAPDHHIYLRLYTASYPDGSTSGTDSANPIRTDSIQHDAYGAPAVVGEYQDLHVKNHFYMGFDSPPGHYLTSNDDEYQVDNGVPFNLYGGRSRTVDRLTGIQTADSISPFAEYYTGRFWMPTSDTHEDGIDGPENWEPIPDGAGNQSPAPYPYSAYMEKVDLSVPDNSLTPFLLAAEGAVPPFVGERTEGNNFALLRLTAIEPVVTQGPEGPEPSSDHRYDLAKLQYKFHCNADPKGRVVYDVVFKPDDQSKPVEHDPHTLPTGGLTEVPGPGKPPLLLDPTQLHGKANGEYQVITIALQPNDWELYGSDNSPLLSFDAEQTCVTGAMVDSIKVTDITSNTIGDLHYVSPKHALDPVVIRAQLCPDAWHGKKYNFGDFYTWEVTAQDGGPVAWSANGNKVEVSRNRPGQYIVKVRAKVTPPAASASGREITKMNVWIVWTDIVTSSGSPPDYWKGDKEMGGIPSRRVGSSIQGDFLYVATIQPVSLLDTTADIPELRGPNETPVPHRAERHAFLGDKLGDANAKWNMARQWRERDLVYGLNSDDAFYPPAGTMYGTIPNANVLQRTSLHPGTDGYPFDDLESNDGTVLYAFNDPYDAGHFGYLSDQDGPKTRVLWTGHGSVNDTAEFRSQFREFVRLEIGRKWYKISDFSQGQTRIHAFFRKLQEVGIDYNGDGDLNDEVWMPVSTRTSAAFNNSNF